MIQGKGEKQLGVFDIDINQYVPSNHLVRKLQAAIDWNHIRELMLPYYSDKGRPGIDPVVLMKMVMVNYIFGIHSMRKTEAEIQVNLAYRWFLGLSLEDTVPDHSTFSKNYERRFKDTNLFETLFGYILECCLTQGYVQLENIYIDSTHIKANANKRKTQKTVVEMITKSFQTELETEINKTRAACGQKPLMFKQQATEKEITRSLIDEEAGLFYKSEKEKMFAYTASTACDANGFILGTYVDAGNKHDSTTFDGVYDKVNEQYGADIVTVSINAGYKTPAIAKKLYENNQLPLMPYKRPMGKKAYMPKYQYIYDEYFDMYICPNDCVLDYNTTNKDGYKIYRADKRDCAQCPLKAKCTSMEAKQIGRHVWEEYLELAEELRHTIQYQKIYKKRQESIEREFANLKERHNMRYTRYKGKARVQDELDFVFACMNLKKLATWLHKNSQQNPDSLNFQAKVSAFCDLFA